MSGSEESKGSVEIPGIERYRRLGLCISCGKNPKSGRVRCESCLAQSRARNRAWLKKQKEDGKCQVCARDSKGEQYCHVCKEMRRAKRAADKNLVIQKYGSKCACCDESTREFLSIVRIEPVGHFKKRKLGLNRKLIKEGFPPGYRVLCWSCNCSRNVLGGECEHDLERKERGEQPRLSPLD